MENASKALLIAGGVLIALIIISMLIMMLNKMSNLKNAQQEQIEIEQLAAFNAEFEAYNKKAMYGTDVITLINKVAENNKIYSGNTDYQIVITLNGNVMTSSTTSIGTDFEQNIFKCTKIGYNEHGRVSSIEINKRD